MKVKTQANVAMFSVVRDLLQQGECVNVTVQGNSMLPFFRSGSTVSIRPVNSADFRKYSVVFADAGDHFVIHRIIAINGNYITLLGDGNVIGTETMTRAKVYGAIDCTPVHLFFARLWLLMRPLRKYPLAVFRRLM